MKKLLLMAIAVGMTAVVATGCKSKAKEVLEEAEKAAEEAAPAAGGEAAGEAAAEESGGGGGGACDQYAKCCEGYIDSLSKVQGIPEATITAAKDSCKQIENLKTMPTAQDACKQALDAMKQGMEAMKAMPGFTVPEACQ